MSTTTRRPDTTEIARFLAAQGVRLEIALPLLARVRDVPLNRLAREGGCSRQLLYFAMRGDRAAPDPLRRAARRLLGVDPWKTWEEA